MCSRKCLRSSNHRHMPCIETIMEWLSRTCWRFKDMFNRNVIEIQETLRLRWCQYPGNHEKPEPWKGLSFWCGNGQLLRCVKLLWTLMLQKVAMGKHWHVGRGGRGMCFLLRSVCLQTITVVRWSSLDVRAHFSSHPSSPQTPSSHFAGSSRCFDYVHRCLATATVRTLHI